jgi:subtilisin family serine protease
MQAVDFSVRFATEQKLPLAINLSFGNTYGSHSGTSLVETYLDSVANLWQNCIVAGSGNEGNSGGHAGGTITSEKTERIEFSVGEYEQSLSLQIWKNYWDDIRFFLLPPGTAAPIAIPDQPGSWRFATKDTQILVYYGEPSPYSINQEIYIDLLPEKTFIRSGIWTVQLSSQTVTGGSYDLWMPASAIRGTATQFLTPSPEITLTIPSTAAKVITVGAYDAYTNTAAPFSGRGYTWNTNQIKPDIIAPGVDITSCAVGGGYEIRSGTSMATPFVSGACALLLQWGIVDGNDPYLYGEKMKAYLIRGARRLPLASRYPNPQTGWGALCVAESIK